MRDGRESVFTRPAHLDALVQRLESSDNDATGAGDSYRSEDDGMGRRDRYDRRDSGEWWQKEQELEVLRMQKEHVEDKLRKVTKELHLREGHVKELHQALEVAELDLSGQLEQTKILSHKLALALESSRRNGESGQRMANQLSRVRKELQAKELQNENLKSSVSNMERMLKELLGRQRKTHRSISKALEEQRGLGGLDGAMGLLEVTEHLSNRNDTDHLQKLVQELDANDVSVQVTEADLDLLDEEEQEKKVRMDRRAFMKKQESKLMQLSYKHDRDLSGFRHSGMLPSKSSADYGEDDGQEHPLRHFLEKHMESRPTKAELQDKNVLQKDKPQGLSLDDHLLQRPTIEDLIQQNILIDIGISQPGRASKPIPSPTRPKAVSSPTSTAPDSSFGTARSSSSMSSIDAPSKSATPSANTDTSPADKDAAPAASWCNLAQPATR